MYGHSRALHERTRRVCSAGTRHMKADGSMIIHMNGQSSAVQEHRFQKHAEPDVALGRVTGGQVKEKTYSDEEVLGVAQALGEAGQHAVVHLGHRGHELLGGVPAAGSHLLRYCQNICKSGIAYLQLVRSRACNGRPCICSTCRYCISSCMRCSSHEAGSEVPVSLWAVYKLFHCGLEDGMQLT